MRRPHSGISVSLSLSNAEYIGIGNEYHSSCKAWASCRHLTGAFRLLRHRRSGSRFYIFVEAAKCAALLIAISLYCDEVLEQVLLQACGRWADLTWSVPNSLSSNTSLTRDISPCQCSITETIS